MVRVLLCTALGLLIEIRKAGKAPRPNETNERNVCQDPEDNSTQVAFPPTEMRLDDNYVFYYVNLARLFVTGIVPFTALTVLNLSISRYGCTVLSAIYWTLKIDFRASLVSSNIRLGASDTQAV